MSNEARKLMLCRDIWVYQGESFPYVLLKGLWLKRYGFNPGDQVIITNPKRHSLLMQVHKTADVMQKEREEVEQKLCELEKKMLAA